jgi:hypothetical protein
MWFLVVGKAGRLATDVSQERFQLFNQPVSPVSFTSFH